MRQAGRYLPEYRALREKADFLDLLPDAGAGVRDHAAAGPALGVDAAILFSDILVPLPAMGVEVTFNPGPHLARAGALGARRRSAAGARRRARRRRLSSRRSGCCGARCRPRCR